MTRRRSYLAVMVVTIAWAAGVEGGQGRWPGFGKKQPLRPQIATSRVEPILRPRADISGGANGIYCTAPWDNGIAVHDLGFIPAGRNVSITVEGYMDNFNPVAAVLVPSIGQGAGNAIKTTTFYDDDSGGNRDPRMEFVAPQDGTYVLIVNDLTDAVVGCYRYQVVLR